MTGSARLRPSLGVCRLRVVRQVSVGVPFGGVGMDRDSPTFDEGLDAYCVGASRSACPYLPETPERQDWLRGWDEAEAIDFEDRWDPH